MATPHGTSMNDRDSFFSNALTFLVTFIGDDDEVVAPGAPSMPFIERVARFVVRAPDHGHAVVGAVAGVLADARLARDAG